MFRMLKRLAFALLVPAAVGLGGWVGWATFTTNVGMDETSAAELSPVDVGPSGERPIAAAADPSITPRSVADQKSEQDALRRAQPRMRMVRIDPEAARAYAAPPVAPDKPASVADQTFGQGVAEQAQPPVQVANTDAAQAGAAPFIAQSEPAPAAERGSGEKAPGGTNEAEPAEQLPSKAGTKDDRPAREQEVRRGQSDTASARKAIAAKREKADQTMQQRSSALAPRSYPPRPFGPGGFGPREAQALVNELRKSGSIEDAVARLGAYGRPPWMQP